MEYKPKSSIIDVDLNFNGLSKPMIGHLVIIAHSRRSCKLPEANLLAAVLQLFLQHMATDYKALRLVT